MKHEFVTVVQEAPAVDRLVVADRQVAIEPRPAPAGSRSIAMDLIQWMTFWSASRFRAVCATSIAVHGSLGFAPTLRNSDPSGARRRATASIQSAVQPR
jgi:hypothetical protein